MQSLKVGVASAALTYLFYVPIFTEATNYKTSHPSFPKNNANWTGQPPPTGIENAAAMALAGGLAFVAVPYVGRFTGFF